MKILRTILRILFFPIGCILLAGTAVMELMADKPSWRYWREYNAMVLEIMWLR